MNQINQLYSYAKKISFFDIAGLMVFFGVLFFIAFTFLRTSKDVFVTIRISKNYSLVRNSYSWNEAPKWYLEQIKVGMGEKDVLGRPIIEIADLLYFENSYVEQTAYVTLQLKATYDKRTGRHTYNGIPLLVGSYQEIKIQGLEISGIVERIDASKKIRKQKAFLVTGLIETQVNDDDPYVGPFKIEGIRNFIANKIEEGYQKEDNQGNTYFKVTSVKKTPAYRTYSTAWGGLVRTEDQDRKNVEIEALVYADELKKDQYFFNLDQPLIIGGKLYTTLNNTEVAITVTDFVEVDNKSLQ
jgi:hypothetical protein